MKQGRLTLWEKIKMEYYIFKYLITDEYQPELQKLLHKEDNLKYKDY